MNKASRDKRNAPAPIYPICVAVLTMLASIAGMASVFLFYTAGERYFNDPLPSYIMLASALLSVALALCIIVKSKGAVVSETRVCAFDPIILLPFVPALICFFGTASSDISMALKIALCLCSFSTAAYHVSSALKLSRNVTLVLSYLKIIFCILIVASLYLDMKVESNSPFKLLTQFAAISVMVSTLADAKKLLSRATIRYFAVAKLMSATLCMLAGSAILSVFMLGSDALGAEYLRYSLFFISDSVLSVCLFAKASRQSANDT